MERKIIPRDGDTSWHNPHRIIPRDFEDVPAWLVIFLKLKKIIAPRKMIRGGGYVIAPPSSYVIRADSID